MNSKIHNLLLNREYLITKKHYGNTAIKSLKIIYVVGRVFDHTEFNNLGYGIISVADINELKKRYENEIN